MESGDPPGTDEGQFGGLSLNPEREDEEQAAANERGTPVDLARDLREAVGGQFDVDPCSGAEPIPIAKTRYSKSDDGLADCSPWFGTVYINPPYDDVGPWAAKAARVIANGDAEIVVMLLPSYATSNDWFADHVSKAEHLCLIGKRLSFYGADTSAPFASILSVWVAEDTSAPDALMRVLDQWGSVWKAEEVADSADQIGLDEFCSEAGRVEDQIDLPVEGDQNTPQFLEELSAGDLLTIGYDSESPLFPDEVPPSPTVRALTSRINGDRVEVLCLSPVTTWSDTERYHLLSIAADDPDDIRAGVELNGWQQLPVEQVHPTRVL